MCKQAATIVSAAALEKRELMIGEPKVRLRNAIIAGRLGVVKRILAKYPDLLENIDSKNGWTSLHYAAYYGRYLICVYLIQLGHDKDEMCRTFQGELSIHLAIENGDEQTAHLLLQHFPHTVNAYKGNDHVVPIHIASRYDHHGCLTLLLGCGVDIFETDSSGNTALHIGMEFGSMNCIKLLVQEGGDTIVQMKNKQGWTAKDVGNKDKTISLYEKIVQDRVKTSKLQRNPSFQTLKTPVMNTQSKFSSSPIQLLHQTEALDNFLSTSEEHPVKSSGLLDIHISKIRTKGNND